jgi:hypothetical protein
MGVVGSAAGVSGASRRAASKSASMGSTQQGRAGQLLGAQARQALLVRDEERGLAVGDAVQDLVGRPPGVEAHRDCAQAGDGPEAEHPLGAVGGQDGHAVAGLDAVDGSEVGGQGGDEVEVLGVGVPAAVLPDHVVGLAEGGGALENVAQGARAVLEDRQGSPRMVACSSSKGCPGPVRWASIAARSGVGVASAGMAGAGRRAGRE